MSVRKTDVSFQYYKILAIINLHFIILDLITSKVVKI